ncbi:gamma-type small acid-soluble spore protein [Neobacillus sp. PS3-40]|uniref:gamma-type small acid-soluble spore protein n=1 Tax=Neobacillus sp. PS3-40 TaxID=3070679 RepID=UPI0027E0573B|nr:gamma-type small acid-soluble spore protein [Neobacillus sp. PS3-40]WML43068.1 gamma-type small acid-soluble spore protein [Neobacillus sp. PS3-40]
MANFNKQPNKTQAGTNIQAQSAAAQGQFGTEFASETNAAEVRQQNAQSAGAQTAKSAGAQGQFGTEFASETNAAEVKKQNQQAEARKSQNSGQFGKQS